MSERFGHSVDGIEYDFKFLYGCIGGVGTFLEDHPVRGDFTNHDEKCHQEALMAWMWLLVLNPFHLILKPQKPWCRGWIHIWLGPWGVSLVLRWPLQGCKMHYRDGIKPPINLYHLKGTIEWVWLNMHEDDTWEFAWEFACVLRSKVGYLITEMGHHQTAIYIALQGFQIWGGWP